MKKMLLVFTVALVTVVLSSYVYGAGYAPKQECRKANSGRFADGYQPSNFYGAFGGQFFNNVEPYAGAPVYVVNNSAEIYGAGIGGRLGGFGGLGAWGGNRVGFRGGDGFFGNGPFIRGTAARQARMSAAMNPYGHPNTPTRSPRDFFAPNPPSIGP